MSFDEAREFLGIGRSLLFRLMRDREIRFAKIGKRVVFRRADLDKFLESKIVK